MKQNEFDISLQRIWKEEHHNKAGAVANYIPELSNANPDDFALAIVTTKGRIYAAGDTAKLFTLQSISKSLAFCLALETAGYDLVTSRVGFEPSGDAFNAIELEPSTQKPYNPMINAGAIAICGLLCEKLGQSAFDHLMKSIETAAGRPLTLDKEVYLSEKQNGHRNKAIAFLLKAHGILKIEPEVALDLYFRQCSISLNVVDLAQIGACLANMGQNASTGAEVFDVRAVRLTLAMMFTCGMYNYAGNWACEVGIPAKSGVSGGIVGVINRQLGLASYSPLLDSKGNSIRGIRSFLSLAEEFGLHVFDCTNTGSAIAARYLA